MKLLKKKRRQTIICIKNTLSIQTQVACTKIEENKTTVNEIKNNLANFDDEILK